MSSKAKNKPLLCDHLDAALATLSRTRGGTGCPNDAALRLQGRILDFVRDNMDVFRAAEALSFLDHDIALIDGPAYAERSTHVAWTSLLRIVRKTTDAGSGEALRPARRRIHASRRGGRQEQVSTVVQAFCARVFKLADRPELHDPAAMLTAQRKIEAKITACI